MKARLWQTLFTRPRRRRKIANDVMQTHVESRWMFNLLDANCPAGWIVKYLLKIAAGEIQYFST